jgi:hypothetical protein
MAPSRMGLQHDVLDSGDDDGFFVGNEDVVAVQAGVVQTERARHPSQDGLLSQPREIRTAILRRSTRQVRGERRRQKQSHATSACRLNEVLDRCGVRLPLDGVNDTTGVQRQFPHKVIMGRGPDTSRKRQSAAIDAVADPDRPDSATERTHLPRVGRSRTTILRRVGGGYPQRLRPAA